MIKVNARIIIIIVNQQLRLEQNEIASGSRMRGHHHHAALSGRRGEEMMRKGLENRNDPYSFRITSALPLAFIHMHEHGLKIQVPA